MDNLYSQNIPSSDFILSDVISPLIQKEQDIFGNYSYRKISEKSVNFYSMKSESCENPFDGRQEELEPELPFFRKVVHQTELLESTSYQNCFGHSLVSFLSEKKVKSEEQSFSNERFNLLILGKRIFGILKKNQREYYYLQDSIFLNILREKDQTTIVFYPWSLDFSIGKLRARFRQRNNAVTLREITTKQKGKRFFIAGNEVSKRDFLGMYSGLLSRGTGVLKKILREVIKFFPKTQVLKIGGQNSKLLEELNQVKRQLLSATESDFVLIRQKVDELIKGILDGEIQIVDRRE